MKKETASAKIPPNPKIALHKPSNKQVPKKAAQETAKKGKVVVPPSKGMSGGKIFMGVTFTVAASSLAIYTLEQQDVLPPNLSTFVNSLMQQEVNKKDEAKKKN